MIHYDRNNVRKARAEAYTNLKSVEGMIKHVMAAKTISPRARRNKLRDLSLERQDLQKLIGEIESSAAWRDIVDMIDAHML